MATSVQNIITEQVDIFLGDSSTFAVSTGDRLAAIGTSIKTLYNEFDFDFAIRTFPVDYFDGINYYDITSSVNVPAFAAAVDLRREKEDQTQTFTRKTGREIAEEIANHVEMPSFAVEVQDRNNILVINHSSKFSAAVIHNADSTSALNEAEVDTVNSDALNLTIDRGEFKEGVGSFNFDLDIDQSANQRLTLIINSTSTLDMTDDEDLSSFIFDAYLPDVTGTSSTIMTAFWGSSPSNYFSGTVTEDFGGDSFNDGWNLVKIDWVDASVTGSPDLTNMGWARIDIAHNSASDDTDFRIDNIRMIRPEKLTLHYQTYFIGVDSTAETSRLLNFWNTSNKPFYSGVYDHFDTYVGHKAAAILFRNMGQRQESIDEESLAARELSNLKKKLPSSSVKPMQNFKAQLKW